MTKYLILVKHSVPEIVTDHPAHTWRLSAEGRRRAGRLAEELARFAPDVILSSDEAVKELLDRWSGIYSHRQEMYTGQQLCSGGLRMLMMVLSQLVTLQLGPANKVISGLWTNLANHAQNGSRAP